MSARLVDVNVYLSRWPFRRLPYDSPAKLVRKLRQAGVSQAWVSSFDGLLHKDLRGVNRRVFQTCQRHDNELLVPVGSLNPCLPGWRSDLAECDEQFGMRVIRLHPNYHGYELNDDRFLELLQMADQHGMIVQLAVRMEDVRTQHPLVRVADVDVAPLLMLLPQLKNLRLVLTNAMRSLTMETCERLTNVGRVYFEISMLEGVGAIETVLTRLPLDRLLFGSYFPFFVHESATLKLRESRLAGFQQEAIRYRNVDKILSASSG